MSFSPDARLFLVSSALSSFAGSFNGLYFNLYLNGLGYGQDWIGLLTSIASLVIVVAALPFGILAGSFGYKRLLLFGMGLQGVSIILPALWPRHSWLVLAAALGGLGGAMGSVVGGPLLAELTDDRSRTQLFGIQSGIAVLAGMAGSALAGLLPSLFTKFFHLPPQEPQTYRAVIITSFFLYLLSFLPLLKLRSGQMKAAFPLTAFRSYRRFAWNLALINGFIGLGAGLLIPFVNLFFRLRFSMPDHLLGLVFALNSLLIGLGNLASPLLGRRFGRIRVVVLCQTLSLPFFFLWGYVPILSLSVVGYLVRATLMNLAGPLFSVVVLESVSPEFRPSASAVNLISWQGGWALGALLSGFVQVRFGFAPLFPTTVILYSVAIALTHRAFQER